MAKKFRDYIKKDSVLNKLTGKDFWGSCSNVVYSFHDSLKNSDNFYLKSLYEIKQHFKINEKLLKLSSFKQSVKQYFDFGYECLSNSNNEPIIIIIGRKPKRTSRT